MEIIHHAFERADGRLVVGLIRRIIVHREFNGGAELRADIADEPAELTAAQEDERLVQLLVQQEQGADAFEHRLFGIRGPCSS